jgi:SAM-dependent methyltransferase
LLASQCAPEMFEALKDFNVQVYHLNTPTTRKVFQKQNVYYGGGSTVGTTAMAVAASFGHRLLGILGYDSSYAQGKSHVLPQPQNEGQKTLDVWIDDREYITTPCMAKQVEEFRPWVKTLEGVFPGIDVRLFGSGLLYDFISHGQRTEATRESEAAKYAEMYKDPTYGMPPHRAAAIASILADRPRGSLLDVGTGRGETLDIARSLEYSAVAGTETVDYLVDPSRNIVRGLLPELPIESKTSDTVTCFEVIEHVLPQDVMPALKELERLARDRVIISAATRSDVRGGVELHPSYRSEAEWMETFKAAWGPDADVQLIGNLSSCGLSPVYEYRLCSS